MRACLANSAIANVTSSLDAVLTERPQSGLYTKRRFLMSTLVAVGNIANFTDLASAALTRICRIRPSLRSCRSEAPTQKPVHRVSLTTFRGSLTSAVGSADVTNVPADLGRPCGAVGAARCGPPGQEPIYCTLVLIILAPLC